MYPPTVHLSIRWWNTYIIDLHCADEHKTMLNDPSRAYKEANSKVQVLLDLSSSLSILKDGVGDRFSSAVEKPPSTTLVVQAIIVEI